MKYFGGKITGEYLISIVIYNVFRTRSPTCGKWSSPIGRQRDLGAGAGAGTGLIAAAPASGADRVPAGGRTRGGANEPGWARPAAARKHPLSVWSIRVLYSTGIFNAIEDMGTPGCQFKLAGDTIEDPKTPGCQFKWAADAKFNGLAKIGL